MFVGRRNLSFSMPINRTKNLLKTHFCDRRIPLSLKVETPIFISGRKFVEFPCCIFMCAKHESHMLRVESSADNLNGFCLVEICFWYFSQPAMSVLDEKHYYGVASIHSTRDWIKTWATRSRANPGITLGQSPFPQVLKFQISLFDCIIFLTYEISILEPVWHLPLKIQFLIACWIFLL